MPILPFLCVFLFLVVWGCVFDWLCEKLRKDHSGLYGQLGRPTFFPRQTGPSLNGSSMPNVEMGPFSPVLSFIFRREHKQLDDRKLSVICDLVLVLTLIFIPAFILSLVLPLVSGTPT